MSFFEGLLGKYGFNNFGARKGGNNPTAMEVNNVSDVPSDRDYNQQAIVQEQSEELSPYKQMLGQMQEQYGQSSEQMEDIMNRVSYHETGPNQRMDPGAIQQVGIGTNIDGTTEMGQGVGRGLFQFETGEGQGGMTAMRRMREYHRQQNPGQEMPAWMDYDPRQGVDASQLTDEQQKMMFMANTAMGKGKSFEGVSPENLSNWWQEHHYAGDIDKTGAFGESMGAYNQEYSPVDSTMDMYDNVENIYR